MTEPAPEPKPASGDSRARDRAVIARITAAERWVRTSDRLPQPSRLGADCGLGSSARPTRTASSTQPSALAGPTPS